MTETTHDSHFGRYLVRQGVITPVELQEALKAQEASKRRIGELALEKGLLTPHQVMAILAEQALTDQPFGSIAIKSGLLHREDLDNLLFSQTVSCCYIGEALLDLGYLGQDQFSRLLTEFLKLEALRKEAVAACVQACDEPTVMEQLVRVVRRALERIAECDFKATPLVLSELSPAYPVQAELPISLKDGRNLLARLLFSRGLVDHLGAMKRPDRPGRDMDTLLAAMASYLSEALDGNSGLASPAMATVREMGDQPLSDHLARQGGGLRLLDTRSNDLILSLSSTAGARRT